jgi:hypothetical protein
MKILSQDLLWQSAAPGRPRDWACTWIPLPESHPLQMLPLHFVRTDTSLSESLCTAQTHQSNQAQSSNAMHPVADHLEGRTCAWGGKTWHHGDGRVGRGGRGSSLCAAGGCWHRWTSFVVEASDTLASPCFQHAATRPLGLLQLRLLAAAPMSPPWTQTLPSACPPGQPPQGFRQ